jgi:LEA14-like dessication related protein
MIGKGWKRLAWVILLSACTPLGLWIYEDPVVTVSRITLELGGARRTGSSPVVVALAVQNLNDYPLSTERWEVSLRLDGVPIGQLKQDSTVPVAMDTTATVALPLRLEKKATIEHLQALGSGTHLFAVRGRATFNTPIGTRRVRFAQEGQMAFGERSSVPEHMDHREMASRPAYSD